jgi:hypothetical protein
MWVIERVIGRVRTVEALGQNLPRHGTGVWIRGKRLSDAAEDVPGNLIKKNAQRQGAIWRTTPMIEPSFSSVSVAVLKTASHLLVEPIRCIKPVAPAWRIKPEFQNLIGHVEFQGSSFQIASDLSVGGGLGVPSAIRRSPDSAASVAAVRSPTSYT